ncbi:MAG: hypothetical protein DRO18_00555 [Thermoprotei archaeon]|nr:MAG: hypothetical protein DRO18_00555 [Thermoprotei archaeon]
MSRGSRPIALVEVTAFLAIFFIVAWYLQACLGGSYGWGSKAVMIVLGLVGIFIHRDLRRYGLIPKDIRFSLKWSLYVALLFVTTSLAFIVVAFITGTARPVDLGTLAIDALWFFIFVGFAEELFFRGYIQSRLNEVFTAKYGSILGVKYRWTQGTLITGVFFFGIPHILTGVNPFIGYVRVTPMTIAITGLACFIGVIFGVLRERTGSIILPTILHGFLDYTVFSIGRVIGLALSNAAAFTALLLFFTSLFRKILEEPISLGNVVGG